MKNNTSTTRTVIVHDLVAERMRMRIYLVIFAIMGVILLLSVAAKKSASQPVHRWAITTYSVAKTAVVFNVIQEDGSVIVREQGASFMMVPVSTTRPKIVPESTIRNMSGNK